MFENQKSEDYMGMISWSRINCGSARPHFGTEVKTSHPIRLKICTANESRELSHNWYFAGKRIVEIEMSPVQWAEFLTSGNTTGVPCTLKYLDGKGFMSEPKETTIKEDYNKEVEESFNKFGDSFDKVAKTLKEQIDTNKPMGKKALEELLREVGILKELATGNIKFVKESFKEDMDKIVTQAKAEFNAYFENRIHEIGIEEMKKGNVSFLENKNEEA
jgi:hypothetical protein